VQPAAQQDLSAGLVQRAIRAGDAAARRWMLEAADPVVANVLYLELAELGLVRLVAPIWIDGRLDAAISLLSRPSELSARDRFALVAAARAVAHTAGQHRAEVPLTFPHRRKAVAALALRAPGVALEVIADALRQHVPLGQASVRAGRDDVRAWLPYESVDQWNASVERWHAGLTDVLGPLTIGHALSRRGTDAATPNRAVVQAAEAALVGERLFGPGQVTSYADAQLGKFLLSQHGVAELRALYERAVGKLAVEDLRQDSQLVATLEVYCETFMTRRTAERLGIHRNTVLYRLKRIEEITSADLDDSPTRLLFQYGLLAGRMLRRGHGARRATSRAWEAPLKLAV
jgi:DNA-binding PucR family transcriptional regulator